MNGYRCNVTDGLHIPDLGKQLILRKYMIRVLCKECQQIKFLCRKLLLFVIYPYTTGSFINADATDLNNVIFLYIASDQTLITRQMCFYPGNQFTRGKWFSNIIIRTKSQTTDFINIILFRGHHQDRCIFFLTDLFTDFKTIGSRQHQIQNVHVKFFTQCTLQTAGSIIFYLHIKSTQLQIIFLQIRNCFFIFYD